MNESLFTLSQENLLPTSHRNYLEKLRDTGTDPKVIFDIGACVLHWTNVAKKIWPNARYVAFDAIDETGPIMDHYGVEHFNVVLTDEDKRPIHFYQNIELPGGSSYYKENIRTSDFFPEQFAVDRVGRSLDALIAENNLPYPDLIKVDVQGSELDIFKGATETLKHVKDIIVELQRVHYNVGAPLVGETTEWLEQNGFELIEPLFSDNGPDGDYHFRRKAE